MKAAVISDTHRGTYVFDKILKLIEDTDMMIHLGDNVEDAEKLKKSYKGRVINVRGNCDFITSVPADRIEIIEGKKVFITHGHKYDVKYGLNTIKYKALELEADIVLFGHTHESLVTYDRGIWFINPGSASLPRDASRSIAILQIENNKVDVSLKII